MLLGLIIGGMGIAVTIIAYVTASQMWKDDLVMNELSRSANIAIERMLHGITENTGLLAAKEILSPAAGVTADSVTYEDLNSASRRFYYSGGKIYTESGNAIISDVGSAAFSYNGRTVLIKLALHKASGSKGIDLMVETRVSPRN
jgi:hypothetical protein